MPPKKRPGKQLDSKDTKDTNKRVKKTDSAANSSHPSQKSVKSSVAVVPASDSAAADAPPNEVIDNTFAFGTFFSQIPQFISNSVRSILPFNRSSEFIWYQVVDIDGRNFKEMSAGSIDRKSICNVDQLRKVVKNANNKTGYLANHLFSVLRVYKDRASFDNNESALEEDSDIISSYGASKEKAIIIVVPRKANDGVQIDVDLSLSTNRIVTAELIRYQYTAKIIAQNNIEARRVCRDIYNKLRQKFDAQPFALIVSSSGTGKTQMAFVFQEVIFEEYGVQTFYLTNLSFQDPDSQKIYRNFRNVSTSFHECIQNDMETLEDFEPTSLENETLFGFGFIYHIIEHGYIGPSKIGRKSKSDVLDLLLTKYGSDSSLYPFFFVDEYQSLKKFGNKILPVFRIICNLFRSLKLNVILTGTDITAANLMSPIQFSRSDASISRPLCFLYVQLPRFSIETINNYEHLPPLLCHILQNSRPLLSKLMCDEYCRLTGNNGQKAFDLKCFQEAACNVATHVFLENKFYITEYGKFGQICLFLNACYQSLFKQHYEMPLINKHFAVLVETKSPAILELSTLRLLKWVPCCTMPNPADDVLLHLLMTGLPDVPAMKDSYFETVSDFIRSVAGKTYNLVFENRIQQTSDGLFLETLLTGAICMSSHVGGYRGCDIHEFLDNLIYQLTGVQVNKFNLLTVAQYLTAMKRVPFLSVPNQPWPTYLYESCRDFFLGNLARTRNETEIDGAICFFEFWFNSIRSQKITFECKDYQNSIGSSTMLKIMNRVPSNSVLHIVVVNQLQNRYSLDKWSDIGLSDKARRCKVRRFDAFLAGFSSIQGMPDCVNYDCLVLFIEVNTR